MPRELRVHGVSGTPPSNLLFSEPVTYDQGWDLAIVFEPNRDDWDVKAFHWGSLTSKSSLTALWILLAPFAMADVAGSGHSYYELTPEFCAARKAVESGDLLRPSDTDMATCWDNAASS